jgi:N utilization substance protein A
MKWTWDKFGFIESRPEPTERLETILREHLPEALFGTVRVVAMAREPGYVMMCAITTSIGNAAEPIYVPPEAIRQIRTEYGDKTVYVIPWSDNPETLIRNALHATRVDKVILYEMIGRAIALVPQDQISQATGPGGQIVRLASKLCGWDLEIMTANELEAKIGRAKSEFRQLDGVTDALADGLVEQGFLSFDDLSVIDPDTLMRTGHLTAAQADSIIEQAEERAEHDQD